MTGPRTLLVLLGLAAAGGWFSWLEIQQRLDRDRSEALPERLFPGLEDRLEKVAAIRLRRGAEELEVRRGGEDWQVPALDGWPARPDAVRRLLAAMTLLRPLAPRTGDARRFARLGVQDPGQEGPAETTWVELLDRSGQRLAGLVVGLANPALARHGRYVRKMGGARAWLVDVDLALALDPLRWVDATIWDLDRSRLMSLEIRHPDGQVVAAARVEAGRPDFRLLELPAGWQARFPEVANYLGAALTDLGFLSVSRAAGDSPPPEDAVHGVYRCAGGLVLETWTWPGDGEVAPGRERAWFGRFAARAAPGSDAEVQEEATRLERRLRDWVFRIPAHKAEVLMRRLDEVAVPDPAAGLGPTPPGQEGEGEEGGGSD